MSPIVPGISLSAITVNEAVSHLLALNVGQTLILAQARSKVGTAECSRNWYCLKAQHWALTLSLGEKKWWRENICVYKMK